MAWFGYLTAGIGSIQWNNTPPVAYLKPTDLQNNNKMMQSIYIMGPMESALKSVKLGILYSS